MPSNLRPPHGVITIKAFPQGQGMFQMSIKDTGVGIKPEDMNHLFVGLHQLSTMDNYKAKGAGLGLALVKYIVEAQGGHVTAKSLEGKGSTFSVILPRHVKPSNH